MENPYAIKDPSTVNTAQLQEQELVVLKDHSTKPPPSVGDSNGLGVYFGSLYEQPGSEQTTFEHDGTGSGRILSVKLWLWVGAAAIICAFVLALFI
jgi:hypothetical protein